MRWSFCCFTKILMFLLHIFIRLMLSRFRLFWWWFIWRIMCKSELMFSFGREFGYVSRKFYHFLCANKKKRNKKGNKIHCTCFKERFVGGSDKCRMKQDVKFEQDFEEFFSKKFAEICLDLSILFLSNFLKLCRVFFTNNLPNRIKASKKVSVFI